MQAIDKQSDRELWNPAIHWLLNMAPAELGAKGTLASTINSLEHGGEPSGVPNTDPYSNYQMGWCVGDSPADKWRKYAPVWFALSRTRQGMLLAHYLPRNDLPPATRARIDGAFGKLANAVVYVEPNPERLFAACLDAKHQGRVEIIKAATKRADGAVRDAHRGWDAVAGDLTTWRVWPWGGNPLGREVQCPQCPYRFRQDAIEWAKTKYRSMPTDCPGCKAAMKEPPRDAEAYAPPVAVQIDDGSEARWSAEYEKRLASRPTWEAARTEEEQGNVLAAMASGLRALDSERQEQARIVRGLQRGLRGVERQAGAMRALESGLRVACAPAPVEAAAE